MLGALWIACVYLMLACREYGPGLVMLCVTTDNMCMCVCVCARARAVLLPPSPQWQGGADDAAVACLQWFWNGAEGFSDWLADEIENGRADGRAGRSGRKKTTSSMVRRRVACCCFDFVCLLSRFLLLLLLLLLFTCMHACLSTVL